MTTFSLSLATLAMLNYAIWLKRGSFTFFGVLFFGIFFFWLVASNFSGKLKDGKNSITGLIIVALFNAHLFAQSSRLSLNASTGSSIFEVALWGSFVLLLLALVFNYLKKNHLLTACLTGVLIILVTTLFQVPFLNPSPDIDVFVNSTAAAKFLAAFQNPYTQTYVDIYNGAYDYPPGFPYWPLIAYTITPVYALLGDIRWTFVLAQLLCLPLGYCLFQRFKLPRNVTLAWFVVWYSSPVSWFVIEQAWIDPLMYPCILGLLLAVDRERPVYSAVFSALLMATKQYSVFFPIVTFLYFFSRNARLSIQYALSTLLIWLGIMAPLVLWDLAAFNQMTIKVPLLQEARTDSFSLSALFLNTVGWTQSISIVFYLGSLLLLAIYFLKQKTDIRDWIFSCFTIYGVVFLFGKQAFCNYYHFLSFLLVLFVAILLRSKSPTAVQT